eukprot:195896_1
MANTTTLNNATAGLELTNNGTAGLKTTSNEDVLTYDDPDTEHQITESSHYEKTLQADIYSFGVSYAYKYKKFPLDLCGCLCLVFVVQLFGVLSIVWSSHVRTSTDVVLKFDTYDIQICYNATGMYYNQACLSPIFDLNRHNKSTETYNSFQVYLQEGDGQFDSIVAESDDPDIDWNFFAMGYVTVTVISLSILSIKAVNAAMSPLSMIMVSFYATDEWSNRRLLKFTMRFIGFIHLILVLFAWGVGYLDIAFYIPKYGLDNPSEVILGPISLIFILEIDHWVIDIVRLRYAPTDYTFTVNKEFENRYNSVVFAFNVTFNAAIFAILIALLYVKWNLFNDANSEAQKTWTYVFIGFLAFTGGSIFSSIPFCCVRMVNILKLYSAIRM